MRKLLAYAAIYILWGGSFLAIRELVAAVPPFFAAGFRFLLAGLILIAYAALRGHAAAWQQLRSAALLGLVMFLGNYACLFWAETRVPSGTAAVLTAVVPIWIFLGELLVLRSTRLTVRGSAGVVLGLSGVLLLSLGGGRRGPYATSPAGVAVLLVGTLLWSIGTLFSRHMQLPRPQAASAGWQMATGGVMLLALSSIAGERPGSHLLDWTPATTLAMAYLVLAASVIAFTAYVWLLGHDSVQHVASYAYVNPLIALVLGAGLAAEHLSPHQVAGSLLVVAGVFVTLTSKLPAQPAPSAVSLADSRTSTSVE